MFNTLKYTIESIQRDDYKKWINIYHKYAEYYEVDIPEKGFEKTWNWLINPSHPLRGLVVKENEEIIAFGHYRGMPSPLDSCDVGFLDDLYVLPDSRGNKIGEALIEKIKEEGKKEGWLYINWITKDNNYRARSLYDKLATKTDWNYYELSIN